MRWTAPNITNTHTTIKTKAIKGILLGILMFAFYSILIATIPEVA